MKQKNTISQQNLLRPFIKYTDGLPILERKAEILEAIAKNQVVIIAGETGSGKTTQLPVICLEAGLGTCGKIGCTQPRRIAAISIANRVAEELKCQIGREVGYKIRFNDHDSPQTAIKFMTDGILLAEIEQDPNLSDYDTLIIDEAHERSLNIDFILGYLRKLLPKRPELKVIISSATIDTALFSRSFNNAPVIEVSGRMYPVEILYLADESNDEEDSGSYTDAAVKAVEDLLDLYTSGDILVFMPTERDIRETCERLNGLKRSNTVILPLYARLSRQEQESIFNRIEQRKIVVATNIAETSITVPGIRFVVDTGLARISRYVPRLRTNRLPIEPVSKAAADQRMGRCGRVMDGICIRLYSEKNYLIREPFTQPEIKRSNLAGVILSMIAHKLGNIEEFAFLEPPVRTAISEGYALLRELGAIDGKNQLTKTGWQMSRLPLDPHIARIVLAAKDEHALREIKIIAAALSIVDPRERPFDKQNEADAMHKRFTITGSDFLTYVKLWDTYRQELGTLKTQNKMRKFCKDHFLSFTRMQEWFDVHQQIHETLSKMKGFEENTLPATADSVHRSLLPGLLSNCARKNEQNKYRAARGRELIIFPGSSLYGQKPEWIVCHEMIETSQLFAHTVAPISSQWLEEIAAHLCTRNYSEPWFDSETGVVKATERVSLFGLEINVHSGIHFGKINKEKANEIFIWQGLVEEQLESSHHFYVCNKNLRREIETLEAKLRTHFLFAGEIAIADFYRQRLTGIGSVHDLNKLIKQEGNDSFLCMNKEDLITARIPDTVTGFPDKVSIGGKKFNLDYVFNPGSEKDGITLKVSQHDASFIPEASLGYLVPALWPAKIEEMLRALPKDLRKQLQPISERAEELAKVITTTAESFEKNLSRTIRDLYNIDIDPAMLRAKTVPEYLEMRVEVHDQKGKIVSSGRGAETLRKIPEKQRSPDTQWHEAFKKYEKHGLTEWNFETIPEHFEVVPTSKGIPLYGYPALKDCGEAVDLLLFKSKEEAQSSHQSGVKKLIDLVLAQEFAWIERDCRFTQQVKLFCNPIGGAEKVKASLVNSIREYLLSLCTDLPRTKAAFDQICTRIKESARGIGFEALTLIEKTLELYCDNNALISKVKEPRHTALKEELQADLSAYIQKLQSTVPYSRFRQYPRYLKAFGYRITRAFIEPMKYSRNQALLRSYTDRILIWEPKITKAVQKEVEEYQAMLEEFAISLFSQQEIKTLFPISIQRLEKKIAGIELMLGSGRRGGEELRF